MLNTIKVFIYLVFIIIIAILNNVEMADAKSPSKLNNLLNMNEPPENHPQFNSFASRIRRNVGPHATDGDDIPKDQFYSGSPLRTRRQAPPGESDIPKELKEDTEMLRAKRQIPSPPGDMPMPPM